MFNLNQSKMKKLIGLLLVGSFCLLVSSAQANSEVSYDKVSHVKQAVKSDVVLNVVSFEYFAFVADGQYIDMTINNSCEYVHPVGET